VHPRVSTILLAELDGEEHARLRDCPSIISRLEDHPVLYSIYSLPPVRYPDGKTYFKIGGQLHMPNHRYSRDGLIDWFHGEGNREEVEALSDVLYQMIPDLRAISTLTKPCVVGFTSHDRPYIDSLDGILGDRNRAPGRLYLASGPDAAKSSVEIGRLAARMVAAGAWDDDLPAEWFRIC
jgi:sarcosine oxidase